MRTVMLKCIGVVIAWIRHAAWAGSTNFVMIASVSGVAVCAIIKNPMYMNIAGGLLVFSPYKEGIVPASVTPFINLNINAIYRQGREGDCTHRG